MEFNQAENAIIKEIKELHQFFENWFSGKSKEIDFTKVTVALTHGFEIISPSGIKNNRQYILEAIKKSYNTNTIRIWTENIKVKQLTENFFIATYNELQMRDKKQTSRISTAIFRYNGLTPNNFEWVHVHETWNQLTEG